MGRPLNRNFTLLYLLDWATTWFLLELGGSEANPFLTGLTIWHLLGLKLLILPLLYALWTLSQPVLPRTYLDSMTRLGILWFTLVNLWNVGRIGILLEQTAAG